jgi:GTP-binding protein EngB required for normal cell division
MKTLKDLKNDEALSTSTGLSETTRPRKTANNFDIIKEPDDPPPKLTPNTPIIIVFGLIGVGKTTFINKLTGSNRPTSDPDSYVPCTKSCYMAIGQVDGRKVCFVDTPGFGNPTQTSQETLSQILQWFSANIGTTRKITAALYLQSVMRKGGKPMQNTQHEALDCFVLFVGTQFSKNVGLVSTHWDAIEKPNAPLVMKRHWKKLLGKEARRFHVYNDQKSSVQVVGDLLKVEPGFIEAQKDLVAGRAMLEGLRTAYGVPRISGASGSSDEAPAAVPGSVTGTSDNEANGLNLRKFDLFKNH